MLLQDLARMIDVSPYVPDHAYRALQNLQPTLSEDERLDNAALWRVANMLTAREGLTSIANMLAAAASALAEAGRTDEAAEAADLLSRAFALRVKLNDANQRLGLTP